MEGPSRTATIIMLIVKSVVTLSTGDVYHLGAILKVFMKPYRNVKTNASMVVSYRREREGGGKTEVCVREKEGRYM